MSFLRKIVKSIVLAPVEVVRGAMDALVEAVDPPKDRK